MSYIIKSTSPFVSIKLTEKGREMLSQGKLNFSFWAIGDSEIDYNREALINPLSVTLSATSVVMRPLDRQPNIKSFILPSTTTDPYRVINSSVLSVVKAVVNNEANERGFFYLSGSSYITKSDSEYSYNNNYSVNTVTLFTGGTNFVVQTTGLTVGDVLLIKYPKYPNGTLTANNNSTPLPNLFYRIQSFTGINTTQSTVTLDRPLPTLGSTFTGSTQYYLYKGGEVSTSFGNNNSTSYWDTGTLAFDSSSNVTCSDVPVWNMNNVWCEDLAGVTGLTTTKLYEDYTKFGSYAYLGQKNPYLEYLSKSTTITENATFNCDGVGAGGGGSYLDDISKSISIIHYTNNTISNLYGEFFYTDAANGKHLVLELPDLMYHRRNFSTASGTTMGMRFLSTGGTKTTGTDIQYIDLFEDTSLIALGATPSVVGRVYPQMKTVVFHDDEIIASMSHKSNRNWTLPELSVTLASPSGGTSTGILETNNTMYLTYVLDNLGHSGYTSSMPCQKYVKITNKTSSAKDIEFKINGTDLLPFMRKIENSDYDGLGFYAHNFKLLYQIVANDADRPDAGSWKSFDYTSTAITGVAGESIDPKLLEVQIPYTNGFLLNLIKDATSITFDLISLLNLPATTTPKALQFGDEKFFYGNLKTYIGATIYKTIFNIGVSSSEFNTTTNITRSKDSVTNPPNIKLSEVGIYDADKNLVCIGKVSTPIELKSGNNITLELSMDF